MSEDAACVWIATKARPLPHSNLDRINVVILVCEDGNEEEALELLPVLQTFPRAKAVLVGRLTTHNLHHFGALVQHVIALPATEQSQLGGGLWTHWASTKKGARPWETLRLDLTYVPDEKNWVRAELQALRKLRIATTILPDVK